MNALQLEITKAVTEAMKPLVHKIDMLERKLVSEKPLIDSRCKARQLGVTPETVRKMVREGRLKCRRNGNRMMFSN